MPDQLSGLRYSRKVIKISECSYPPCWGYRSWDWQDILRPGGGYAAQ
jgi:hypothetical protein